MNRTGNLSSVGNKINVATVYSKGVAFLRYIIWPTM